MKKTMLVLVLATIVALVTNAYALDFRGLRLGMTVSEIAAWISKNTNIETLEFVYRGMDGWPEQSRVQLASCRVLDKMEDVISGHTILFDGRLQRIEIIIRTDDFGRWREAILKKYGGPVSSEKRRWQNKIGGTFIGSEEYWKIGTEYIWLQLTPHGAFYELETEKSLQQRQKPLPKL